MSIKQKSKPVAAELLFEIQGKITQKFKDLLTSNSYSFSKEEARKRSGRFHFLF